MPEASVDEDDGVVFRQDDVGFAGKGFVFRTVHGEAVAEAVEQVGRRLESRLCGLWLLQGATPCGT